MKMNSRDRGRLRASFTSDYNFNEIFYSKLINYSLCCTIGLPMMPQFISKIETKKRSRKRDDLFHETVFCNDETVIMTRDQSFCYFLNDSFSSNKRSDQF